MGVYISVLEEGGGLVEEEGRGEKEKRSAKTREDSEEVHQAIASGDKNEEGKIVWMEILIDFTSVGCTKYPFFVQKLQ
jgi:hypothetical protein